MTFGEAIELLKQGKRVQRRGWNGKGMFLWLCTDQFCDMGNKPFIVMRTAQGEEQPGWLASQPDMLEEDWDEYADA